MKVQLKAAVDTELDIVTEDELRKILKDELAYEWRVLRKVTPQGTVTLDSSGNGTVLLSPICQPGRMWELMGLYVQGTDDHTAMTVTAAVLYIGGIQQDLPSITTLPQAATYSRRQKIVLPNEKVEVKYYGGTASALVSCYGFALETPYEGMGA